MSGIAVILSESKAWGLLSTLVTSGWYFTGKQGDPSFKSKRYQFLHWHRLQEQNTMPEQGAQHYRKKWMMSLYSAEHSERVHDVLASLHYKSLWKKNWNFVFHRSYPRRSIIESGVIGKLVYFSFWQMSHLKRWWKKMKTDTWSTWHEVPLFSFFFL